MTTKYRGAMISNAPALPDIAAMNATQANIVRFQFMGDLETASMAELIKLLETTNKHVIIAMMRFDGDAVNDPFQTGRLIELWRSIIERFDGYPRVFGYDIFNEPVGSGKQVNLFMQMMYSALRPLTQKKLIISNQRGLPQYYSSTLFKPDCWHTVHMYWPMRLTHQGVLSEYPVGPKYPKPPDWTKHAMKYHLRHVRNFQIKHRARIYVGEFGISNLAGTESRKNWLKDCISIFEEYGWHWSYHAYREAPVWDLEADGSFSVMEEAWKKNL